MSGIIQRQDLITDEAFNWPKVYKGELERLVTTTKKLGTGGGTKKSIDELTRAQNALTKATERSTPQYIQAKAALDKLNKSNREAVKDTNAQASAYDKLSRELEQNRKAYKDLAAAGKANTKQAKALRAETLRLDSAIKKIDKSVGQSQRRVGSYAQSIKNVAGMFIGVTAAVFAFIRVMKSGFNILVQYTSANSTLRGILRATREETRLLREQQKELGASTAFTATQVTNAQTELARLGMTMSEITLLTPAILDAAVALGVDMADAAELVAGQLNAFNLQATEGKRVADVLVRATQISAFNYERLATSLSVVSPAAKAAGATLEQTTAIMSAAVDANIDASTAATGLRNIFIELSNKGLTWDQAMAKINSSTDKLGTANELFGKRSAVVSLVIADNTQKIEDNKKALEGAEGAAKKFADEQLDNLKGDMILLTSAWEGFILALEEGDGFMSKVLRWTIQDLTNSLRILRELLTDYDPVFENWKNGVRESGISSENLQKQITMLTTKLEQEKKILAEVDNDFTGRKENIAGYEKQLKFLNDYLPQVIATEKKAADELAKLNAQHAAGVLTAEELAKKQKQLEKALKAQAQSRKDAVKDWLDLNDAMQLSIAGLSKFGVLTKQQQVLLEFVNEIFGENTIDADGKAWVDSVGKQIKKVAKVASDARKKETEETALELELRNELLQDSMQGAAEIVSSFANFRIQQIQQQMEFNEFQRDRDLKAAGDNERRKEEINKQFDAKRKQLQKKQANTEKANALFQIAINTATGISKTLSTLGLPAATPFIALAAILGAVQAAAVIAQPVPQFDEGTQSTPKQYIAGEKRPEFRLHANKWSLVDRPTKFDNSAGDTIVSGAQTDSILGTLSDLTGTNILKDKSTLLNLLNDETPSVTRRKQSDLAYILQRNNQQLINTIKNKKEVSVKVSSRGNTVREKSGNVYVDRIDYYYNR